jgi:Zn-dependent protease with chaperone function
LGPYLSTHPPVEDRVVRLRRISLAEKKKAQKQP